MCESSCRNYIRLILKVTCPCGGTTFQEIDIIYHEGYSRDGLSLSASKAISFSNISCDLSIISWLGYSIVVKLIIVSDTLCSPCIKY